MNKQTRQTKPTLHTCSAATTNYHITIVAPQHRHNICYVYLFNNHCRAKLVDGVCVCVYHTARNDVTQQLCGSIYVASLFE